MELSHYDPEKAEQFADDFSAGVERLYRGILEDNPTVGPANAHVKALEIYTAGVLFGLRDQLAVHIVKEETSITEGRIVHYVMPPSRNYPQGGQHRGAIINNAHGGKTPGGVVNLTVFLDQLNDGPYEGEHKDENGNGFLYSIPDAPMWCLGSVKYSETKEPGTWHWIERTEADKADEPEGKRQIPFSPLEITDCASCGGDHTAVSSTTDYSYEGGSYDCPTTGTPVHFSISSVGQSNDGRVMIEK